MEERSLAFRMLALFLGVMSLLALVGVFISVGAYKVFRGSAPVANSVTIQGTGEVMAVPDIAQISLTVTEEAKTATDSQTKVTTKMNKVIDYLKEQGIDEKDIKTTGYYTNPKYETQYGAATVRPSATPDYTSSYMVAPTMPTIAYPCTDYGCPPYTGKSVIVAYETSHSLDIKIRDTNKAGDIMAGISKIGVTYTSGVSLTFDDYKKLQDEARLKAITDARTQAEELARSLGVSLGRVVSFSEYGNPMYYGKEIYAMSADAGGRGGEIPPSPQLPTGENKITASVTVVYEIR